MKKIALLAMLCVFSIVGVQSAQAAEEQNFDVKNRPQFERQQDFNRYEKGKLSDKEIQIVENAGKEESLEKISEVELKEFLS